MTLEIQDILEIDVFMILLLIALIYITWRCTVMSVE